jgi:hypothetical protein
MDFEKIDEVAADCVERGDIIEDDGDFYLVKGIEDEGDLLDIHVEPLSAIGTDDTIILDPDDRVSLYRSY